jgi:hypothetical protein
MFSEKSRYDIYSKSIVAYSTIMSKYIIPPSQWPRRTWSLSVGDYDLCLTYCNPVLLDPSCPCGGALIHTAALKDFDGSKLIRCHPGSSSIFWTCFHKIVKMMERM